MPELGSCPPRRVLQCNRNPSIGKTLMTDLIRLSAIDIAKKMAQREITAEQYVRALLARIDERDGSVRAFVHVGREPALAAAKALDQGAVQGMLHGIPLGVKDIFETYDMPTQGGSNVYKGLHTALDAACVAATRRAGGIILGKTVTTELATFPHNETRNPHNLEHTPGGSSSGSAAAVADFMLPLATGTQTLGSTIRPGSFCGVVAYKPTYNLIPKKGVWNSADSLDTVGGFARSVPDIALWVAGVMSYRGLLVPESVPAPRIGLCKTHEWDNATPEMQACLMSAAAKLAKAGAVVKDVTLPDRFKGLLQAQIAVGVWETGRSFADECHRFGEKLRPELFERCGHAYDVDPAVYHGAQALGRECRQMIPDAMGDCDVLLAPAAPGEAPKGMPTGNPIFNQVWTFLHTPCVGIPAGIGPQGLPLGLQVVGRLGDDARTLAAAHWVHQRLAA
ncbi:MAG: amidase [Betaproteobacteria bacterium]|nr:amidase [Betaproteobacteria bacterium]